MIREDLFAPTEKLHLKIRCPNCFKLYSVDSSEIKEAKPRFQCVGCEQRFWVPFPESMEQKGGLIGFPLEWIEKETPASPAAPKSTPVVPEVKPFNCPKCQMPYSGGDVECSTCGIVFAKFKGDKEKFATFEVPGSRDLKDAWDDVIQSYDNFEVHQKFIRLAQAEQALGFAIERYGQILTACPHDEFAQKAQKELVAISTVKAEVSVSKPMRSTDLGFKFPKLSIGTFLMFLCAVVMVMGLLIPGARNLVGFGSAVLFVMLALRFYFRVL